MVPLKSQSQAGQGPRIQGKTIKQLKQLVTLPIRFEICYLIYHRYKNPRQQEKQNLYEEPSDS